MMLRFVVATLYSLFTKKGWDYLEFIDVGILAHTQPFSP